MRLATSDGSSRERIGAALGLTAVLADRSFVTEPAPKLQALSGELEAVLGQLRAEADDDPPATSP